MMLKTIAAKLLSILLILALMISPLTNSFPAYATGNWYDDVTQIVMTVANTGEVFSYDFSADTRELHYQSSNNPEVIFPLYSFDQALSSVALAEWKYLDIDGNPLNLTTSVDENAYTRLLTEVYGSTTVSDPYEYLAYEKGGFGITVTPTNGEAATFYVYFDPPYYLNDDYAFMGSGTESDPYQIANDAQLMRLSALWNCPRERENLKKSYFQQTRDIEFSGTEFWRTIGRLQYDNGSVICNYAFTGTYDGGNHLIKKLKVDKTGIFGNGIALFGAINGATIKNVVIDESCTFSGDEYVAGVVAYADGECQIENCVNYATIYAKTINGVAYAGGILGSAINVNKEVAVTGCKNFGAISGNPNITTGNYYGAAYVGGVIGYSNWPIVNCANYGSVSGGVYVGGVAGFARIVLACSNAGAISSSTQSRTQYGATGGVVGKLNDAPQGTDHSIYFEGCYNTGTVTADYPGLGGLIGWAEYKKNYPFSIENSYQSGSVILNYSGANDACAGQLIGRVVTVGSAPSDLYYVSKGSLPDYGYKNPTAPELSSNESAEDWMRGAEFLDALQAYNTASLTYATWSADSNNANLGFPVISGVETKLNYAKDILSATIAGVSMGINEDDQTATVYLPYNAVNLQSATVTVTVSPSASILPASGTAVDFSTGPVIYTVTAEDGSTKQYSLSVNQADSPDGLTYLKIDADVTSSDSLPLITLDGFSQQTYNYEVSLTEAELIGDKLKFSVWASPATNGTKMTYSLNGGAASKLAEKDPFTQAGAGVNYYKTVNKVKVVQLVPGENTLVLTVGSVSYTLKLYLTPTLSDLLLTDGANDYPVVETENGWAVDIPADVTAVTVKNAVSKLLNTPVTINGNAETALDITGLNTIEIKAGTEPYQSVYSIKLIRTNTCNVSFTLKPAGAILTVLDKDGQTVNPNADGSYTLIGAEGYTYTYRATLAGYQTIEDTLTAEDLSTATMKIRLNLVKASSGEGDSLFPAMTGDWLYFRSNPENNGVVDAETPISTDNMQLLWAAQIGTGYNNSPTPPMLLDGYVYLQIGSTLCKLDPDTGEVVASGETMGRSNYTTNPIACGAGMVFVLIDSTKGGVVQALDAETLTSLWVSEPIAGQMISPLTYHNGYLYTGTWKGETGDGYYFCLPVTDEDTSKTDETQHILWSLKHKGGFYWAGAYATDNYVVFGSDDGLNGYEGVSAVLYSVKPGTGEIISRIDGLVGDIRSAVAYAEGKLYFTSKGGYLYQVAVDENGNLSDCKALKMSGMATGTPVIYNGTVFASSLNGVDQFNSPGAVYAVNTADMSLIAQGETRGYNQASLLLSTAYEDEGKLYLYGSYNREPGGLEVIFYDIAQKQFTVTDLFEPAKGMRQYGICSPICNADGTIYYKNDSGYVFALKNIKEENESKAADAAAKIAAIGQVTLESEQKISAARTAYDALTDVQKNLVTNLAALEAAETAYTKLRADKDAAEAVEAAIGEIGTVTLSSYAKITAARTAYDALTAEQKALVENLAVLEAAETKYAELAAAADQAEIDENAARGADELMDAIGTVTLESETAITKARTAYDALSEAQKALVTKLDALTAAEAKLAELKAVRNVEEKIAAIGQVTLESEAAVKEARAAYDALTDQQKTLVAKLDELTAAETKLTALKADKAAAEAVEEKIAAIGEVTKDSEDAIFAARAAYDALTEDQQELVSSLSVLAAAEAKLKELRSSGSGSSDGEKIKVSMWLIGAELAEKDVDLGEEAYLPNYVTWIAPTTYELNKGAVVYDLFVTALRGAGISSYGEDNNYVSTIYAPEGYELSEFTNGYRSGWMYTVNGRHPGFGLRYWELHDGDVVIWHYVNDYSYEVEDWFSEEQWPSLGDGTYYNRWLLAPRYVGGKGGGVGGSSGSGTGSGTGSGSGSGGSSSGSGTTTETETEESVVTVTPEVTDGEAKAEVTAEAVTEALEKTEEAEVLTVKVETEEAESVEAALSADTVKAAAEAEVDLHIETENGTVKIGADTLKEAAEEGKEVSVTVKTGEDGTTTFEVTVGGEPVEAKMKVELPAAEDSQVLVIVKEDGTEEVVKKSVVEDGKAYAEIPAGATVKVVENEKEFVDVKDSDWYADAVEFASSHELFQGVSETEFAPKDNMTRAMLVTVLFRLEDQPESAGKLDYPDVADGAWYADAAAWATEAGLVNGTDKGFEPNENVSREQIATILYRYVKSLGLETEAKGDVSKFSDGDQVSDWAKDAMAWAVDLGLFQGDGEKLDPKGDATRGQVAALMQRLVGLIVK